MSAPAESVRWSRLGRWFRHRRDNIGARAAARTTERASTLRWQAPVDPLERRTLFSGDVVISEFLAVNGHTLADQDGEYSDWIELHNTSAASVDLGGWYLTDDAANLTKWTIPSTTVAPDGYLIVFASNKDRAVAGQQLHTNFKLDADGEYLGLVEPDGVTVSSDYAPTYPPQEGDVSYGIGPAAPAVAPLVAPGADAKVLVPSDGTLGEGWTQAGFDDSAWSSGQTGVGFEIGQTGPPALPEEAEPNDTVATADDATANFAPFPGVEQGLYQLGIKGSVGVNDGDFFQLGALQAGDVLTLSGSGAGGTRGTLSDGYLELYRAGGNVAAPTPVLASDDEGPGADSLIYRFRVTTDDTYYAKVRGFSPNQTGTYDFAASLENAPGTPAPETGGTLAREAEPNNTAAAANNAASSWRPVQYRSVTAGAISSPSEVDYFRFRFTAGDAVTFTVDSASSLEATLIVAGASGTPPLASDNGDDNVPVPDDKDANVFTFLPQTSGIFNVAVRGAGGSGGSYDLEVKLSSNTPPPAGALYGGSIKTDLADGMFGVNASAYLRVPFDYDSSALPGGVSALTLGMKYDDGFVAYLNGTEVARRNAPDGAPAWDAAAPAERADAQSVLFENIDLTAFRNLLVDGQSVLAIQGLNDAAGDDDFLILPRLSASTPPQVPEPAYFVNPTPGAPNNPNSVNTGPLISNVTHTPDRPGDADDVVVTAKVSAPPGSTLTSATLKYRVMFAAEVSVDLLDDGAHGDGTAGDGVFGATIPAAAGAPAQMVRYAVAATDSFGRNSRAPVHAALNSPQYFGYVVANPAVDSSTLPVFHFFAQDANAARTRTGTRASVYFDGEFYDNVFVRDRGGNTSDGFKFDFNPGYHFKWTDDPAASRVDEININYNSGFDETRLRAPLAFETFTNAGVPSLAAAPWRIQQNGTFYRMADFVENPDEDYLDRVGLAGGSLYKMEFDDPQMNSAFSFSKHARKNEGFDDLQSFLDGIHQSGEAKTKFLFDNVDIPQFLNYWAANTIVNDNDDVQKNYFLYRDTEGDGKWRFLPWDKDLTFGKNYGITDYASRDPQTHPFFGDSNHPKIDGPGAYNYLIDALLDTPVIKQMYLRRLRTLMDQLLQPSTTPLADRKFEKRIDELFALVNGDAAVRAQMPSLRTSLNTLRDRYLQVRRNHLYIDHSTNTAFRDFAGIPGAQDPAPQINVTAVDPNPASGDQDQEYIQLSNPNAVAVDVSGWTLSGAIGYTLPPGLVIPANGSAYVARNLAAFLHRSSGPGAGQGLLAVGGYDGQLSARGETVVLTDVGGRQVSTLTYDPNPTAAQRAVRITEVMYHPANAPNNTPIDEQFEYVELQNISDAPVSLKGLKFTQGLNLVLGDVTLQPGAFAVVVKDRAAFESRYGAGAANIIGTFGEDNLNNAGERIRLEDASGEVVTDFHYDSQPWYPSTDGLGRSLVIRDPSAEVGTWGDKAAWRPSAAPNGSPGAADGAPAPDAPTVDVHDVTPDPRSTPVDSITVAFSEPVYGLDLSDLALTVNGLRVGLGPNQTLTTSDGGATWVLGNLAGLAGAGGQYALTLDPTGSGIADYDANALAAGDADSWTIAAPAGGAAVAGRWMFYNNSAFDGRNPAATAADLAAVAWDKQALLPGQPSSFANLTGSTAGINGLLIDFAGTLPQTLLPEDFAFRVGSGANVSAWLPLAVAPTVTPLGNPSGPDSARYALTWPDRTMRNTWLEVTVLANARTGLTRPDVFYFGNLAGETGDTPVAATGGGVPAATGGRVNALDLGAVKRALNTAAGVASRIDVNHDGRINALDLGAIKGNLNAALAALTAPAAGAARSTTAMFSNVAIAPASAFASAAPKRGGVWETLQR